jgi:subtilase family serine protease
MPTTSRFVRGFSNFRSVARLAMGLSLGLIPSCMGLDEATNQSDQAINGIQLNPAQLRLDRFKADEQPVGSVCNEGPIRCHAHALVNVDGHVQAAATPQGWGPADLQSAYNIPTTISGTPTVAIVDAYGYANLESDLGTYRSTYNLPACTTANGCLKIVNQTGQTTPLPANPPANDDWTLETALDVDMASAACPSCKILVVQATDNAGDGLYVGQNAAAQLGATVISNSWGGPEQPGTSLTTSETYFAHPGIAVFVSAGDAGYNDGGQGPDYPATSANVIAVGGTSLTKTTGGRGWTEAAWSSGGSACSLSIPKPSYQTGTMCQYKATTDIAAVGDPQTGVAIYNQANGGWSVIGGTSASAPMMAAIFAATGNGGQTSGAFVMQNAAKLNDVTTGTNGTCGTILCKAGPGWDGPTGYGTPNATALMAQNTGGTGSGSDSTGGNGTGGGGTDPSGGGSNPSGGGGQSVGGGDVVGGCAAGGSGAGLGMILALGFVAVRRRRTA